MDAIFTLQAYGVLGYSMTMALAIACAGVGVAYFRAGRDKLKSALFTLSSFLFALLFEHWLKDLARYDLDWMELAWIVESNRILVDMLRESLGPPVRVYRVYEASVESLLAPEGSA